MSRFKVRVVPKEASSNYHAMLHVPEEDMQALRTLYQTYQIRTSHLGFMIEVKLWETEGSPAKSHTWTPATTLCKTLGEAVLQAIDNYGSI